MDKTKFFLLVIILCVTSGSCYLKAAFNVWRKAWHLADNENYVESFANTVQSLEAYLGITAEQFHNSVEGQTSRQIIDGFGQSMNVRFRMIKHLLRMITAQQLSNQMTAALEKINQTHKLYIFFSKKIEEKKDTDDHGNSFAAHIIRMLKGIFEKLHQKLENANYELLKSFDQAANNSNDSLCVHSQSIKYVLMTMHLSVIIAEIQAGIMLSMSHSMLNDRGSKRWREGINMTKTKFEKRFREYALETGRAMLAASGDIRACDPEAGWVRNKTYFEAEKFVQSSPLKSERYSSDLFQRYIVKDGNERQPKTCNDVAKMNANGGIQIVQRGYPFDCNGFIGDCEFLGTIDRGCLPAGGIKRMEWVELSEARKWGPIDGKCPTLPFRDFPFLAPPETPNCICDCFEENNWIALGMAATDYEDNMVITGLRLIRLYRTFYIQVKQGKLLPYGQIDPTSETWLDPPVNTTHKFPLMRQEGFSCDTFALDDLFVPHGSLLVGVGFDNELLERGLLIYRIEAYTVQFDFKTGQLFNAPPVPAPHPYNSLEERQEFIPGSINPIYSYRSNVPSPTKKYIRLTRSSLESDVGQSTLPLFDGVAVETNPPSPVGGVGFFHKGREGYGGFFSLRIHSLPYELYILGEWIEMFVT